MVKPKIAILTTGGTIAGFVENAIATTGYTSGILSANTLMQAVPQIQDLAEIFVQEIASIDSADITNTIQLKLAQEIHKLFEENFNGVVVTHGTDTLEETAYFLSLTIKSHKPVILVGAMRPLSAMSADGPKNLYNAVSLAINPQAKGVMIVINDRIQSAREATKIHSLNVESFYSPNSGDLGYILDGSAYFYRPPLKTHTRKFPFDISTTLPKVDILYTYSNDGSAVAAKALVANGTQGLVIAASGSGSIHKNHKETLKELLKQGINIVISSRVLAGRVLLSYMDSQLGFISSGDLNPQKARILLMFALTKTKNPKKIQEYFLKY